jgi:Holliday junction resolvase
MSKKKGDRNEREATNILEDAGWTVETPNYTRYQNTDFFNLFDLMAFKDGQKPLFIQVKTNGARGITSFSEDCAAKQFPFDFARAEYWTRYSREGWRVDKIRRDGYENKYDERDKEANIGEFIKEEYGKSNEAHSSSSTNSATT